MRIYCTFIQIAHDNCNLAVGFGCFPFLLPFVLFLSWHKQGSHDLDSFFALMLPETVSWVISTVRKPGIGLFFHVQKWQRMSDRSGHVVLFDCALFYSSFALSGTALCSFLLVYSYSLLLLIPVELCKYKLNLMAPLQNVHARSLITCQLSFAWAEMVLVQSLQELAQWVLRLRKRKVNGKAIGWSVDCFNRWKWFKHLHHHPLATVHIKHSSDPDKKNLSLLRLPWSWPDSFPLHVLEVQIFIYFNAVSNIHWATSRYNI